MAAAGRIIVGLVQPKIFFDSKLTFQENDKVNAEHAVKLLGKFKKNEVDIVVFPELYPGHLEPLKRKARELNAYIIAGEKYRGHNSAAIISPTGRILGRHYKLNLWHGEPEYGFVPGKKLNVFNIDDKKIGVLVCYDFADDALAAKLVKKGAKMIIVMASAAPAFLDLWKHDLIYQACRRKVPVVFVNHVLFKGTDAYYGGGASKVVVPFRKLLSYREIRSSRKSKINPASLVIKEFGKGEAVAKCVLNLKKYGGRGLTDLAK